MKPSSCTRPSPPRSPPCRAPAGRRRAHRHGLHDQRYCEIIELKGSPPKATGGGWNTIGSTAAPERSGARSTRPPWLASWATRRWSSTGPRHWVIDTASGETGRRALLPRHPHAPGGHDPDPHGRDLVQTPYTDRTIKRRNSWRWKRGRLGLRARRARRRRLRHAELLADPRPEPAIGDLRTLGRRLNLPPGWRYRTRRLREDFALKASGSATIVQDDLLNTYQLASTPRRPRQRTSHRVSIEGGPATSPP
jgi:hypothetical protein